jgi:L-threonate 2-dehydrogenase
MSRSTSTVGMIGVGIMGSAMAANLAAAGFDVVVHDVAEAAVARAVAAGCRSAGSVARLAAECGVVITSLPSAAALSDVAAEIAAAGGGPAGLIETSTLPLSEKLSTKALMASVGTDMLDCPLSGTGTQAITKDVVAYASGTEELWRQCEALFAGFSRWAPYLGPFGAGTKMKLVANLLVGIHTAAAGEAFALARKAGLDPEMTRQVITAGAGSSRSLEARAEMLVSERYDAIRTMPLSLWRKDLGVISAFAAELDCPTPLFAAATPLFAAAIDAGLGDQDTAAVAVVSHRLAGLSPPKA